jgi:hypothetical protein
MGDTVAAVRGTLRERALDAIERYRSEHPNATISSACTAVAGELGSTSSPVDVPAILRRAAEQIDAAPGTNVLEALGYAHHVLDVPDRRRGDAYYALLEYLPPHVDMLGPWSDREDPAIVASKLGACARTIEKGGPAIVPADPHMPPDLAAVRLARLSGL